MVSKIIVADGSLKDVWFKSVSLGDLQAQGFEVTRNEADKTTTVKSTTPFFWAYPESLEECEYPEQILDALERPQYSAGAWCVVAQGLLGEAEVFPFALMPLRKPAAMLVHEAELTGIHGGLKLFSVMSPWHRRDSEQGTFEELVWAASTDAAYDELVARMAACDDSGCETDEERAKWIEEHTEACGNLMVALPVAETVKDELRQLLAGPEGVLTDGAAADLAQILKVLGKYTGA